ncbi:MAG: CAAX prenyl protease-related protein [Verrucomicrobiota bacterium]
MRLSGKYFAASPVVARVAPFLIFLALTVCQGKFGAASAYWFYFVKTIVAVWLIWEMRPLVAEMRWAFGWEAILVGVAVFAIWVGLDPFYRHLGKFGAPWNPNEQFGNGSTLAWLMIVTRILGSTFFVPPLEEVFYRSFLYRYLARQDFLSEPLNRFLPWPFLATAAIFGFSHSEWLAGILCGMAYQWLVFRKNRLGDAMTAHAITNFLLGVWIVWKHAWHFW